MVQAYAFSTARWLPYEILMEFICGHCNEVCAGDAYRVKSEEGGVLFLDMIVCYHCSLEARALELSTQKIDPPDAGQAQVQYH